MLDPFTQAAGWLHEHMLIPLLFRFDLMAWEDIAFLWVLFALYGVAQVVVTNAICLPLERWFPLARWEDRRSVATDILYTLISRIGVFPLVTFVLFYEAQVATNGFLADHGYVPPTLERFIPALAGHPVVTFVLYAIILDFAEYWRHRLSHRFGWWWALHSLHHAQRRMTYWSDDRNHVLDDLIGYLWFAAVALVIGIPPLQFPLLVLVLRLLESLSHANTRVGFGRIGERILISPAFHRAHHGILAAGQRSCNYGAILPWWDMLLGTADYDRRVVETGDPSAEEALATGSWASQQIAGLRRMVRVLRSERRRGATRPARAAGG